MWVNDAKVIIADVDDDDGLDSGIVHAIDAVLLPPMSLTETPTIRGLTTWKLPLAKSSVMATYVCRVEPRPS